MWIFEHTDPEAKIRKIGFRRVLRHLLFWISVLAFFSSFEIIIEGGKVLRSILVNAVYLPQDIVLVYLILYVIIPKLYLRKRYFFFVLSLLGVLLINLILSFLTDNTLIPLLGLDIESSVIAKRIFSSILTFTFIAGLASFIKLVEINKNALLNKEYAEARSHRAELALLRSQINPHFLFNVFNNIDELIYNDKDKASETLAFLSDSLRYVLQKQDSETVPVQDEVNFISSYLKVASISFNNPEFIYFEADDNLESQKIAPMLFMPFVENCIKHCNRKSISPGIKISLAYSDKKIILQCMNYTREDNISGDSTGLGLNNVKKRLDLLYPGKYSLDIRKDYNKYQVELKITVE
jgi:LytS/YehU family sensor histidine kinase